MFSFLLGTMILRFYSPAMLVFKFQTFFLLLLRGLPGNIFLLSSPELTESEQGMVLTPVCGRTSGFPPSDHH